MNNNKPVGIVLIEKPGSPDVLRYQNITLQQPGPDEVLIAQKAIGVNFLDIFFRDGTFPMSQYPAPIGFEGSGIIEAIGTNVSGFTVGDRVAYYASIGAYAERRVINTNEIFKLPKDISHEQAAAMMIKGLTAHMLIKQSHKVKSGEVVLIHAMTGGVGTLLSQWVRALGATVIGTVGSAAKKDLALKRGFHQVIDLGTEDFVAAVSQYTGGKGVDVVYDGTGKATFEKSLTVVKDGGSAVLYGWPSGMPDIDNEMMLHRKIKFAHDALNDYPLYQDKSGKGMPEIFSLLRNGVFAQAQPSIYLLTEAATAHADMESRKTTGSIILKPQFLV
ncbi:quinone oxidoreductase family protein [Chitinophagaceae bacterium MMS25-I14]